MGVIARRRELGASAHQLRPRWSVSRSLRSRVPREVLRFLPPRQSQYVLRTTRAFAGCDRRLLLRIARWGEIIEVQAGDVLVREDHTDYWFFVILDTGPRASPVAIAS